MRLSVVFSGLLLGIGTFTMSMLWPSGDAKAGHCSETGIGTWACTCGSSDLDPSCNCPWTSGNDQCSDCDDLSDWCSRVGGHWDGCDNIGACGCTGASCTVEGENQPTPPHNY